LMGFIASYLGTQARLLLRERSSLFWVIIFPFIMTVIFGSIYGKPVTYKISLAVYSAEGNTSVVEGIVNGLAASPVVDRIVMVGSLEELEDLLNRPPPRSVDIGLVFPEGFTSNVTSGRQGTVVIAYADVGPWANTSLSVAMGLLEHVAGRMRHIYLKYMLKYVPAPYQEYIVALAEPLKLTLQPIKPRVMVSPSEIRGWMALSMIVVEALFVGLTVGATSFHEERRNGVLGSILAAPLAGWSLLAARVLTALLMVAIAAASSLAAGAVIGASYTASPAVVVVSAVMVVVATLFATSMGLILSALVRKAESAEALATAIAFPLMFLGGIMIPPWFLPEALQELNRLIPISMMAEGIRAVAVYGVEPSTALSQYLSPRIIAVTAAFIAVGVVAYRRMLEKSLEYPS